MKNTTCPICKNVFQTPQGLRGHLNFKHGQCRKSKAVEMVAENVRRIRDWKLVEPAPEKSLSTWADNYQKAYEGKDSHSPSLADPKGTVSRGVTWQWKKTT